MHVRTFVPALLVASLVPSVPALAQGADACASAQSITGLGSFPFDTTAATTDGVPDALCTFFSQSDIQNDVWFSWTAPANGVFTLTTCGLTGMDSKIAVLSACAGPVVACNDDACGFQSSLDFSGTSGTTYLIRLGNYPGQVPGTGTFTIQQGGQPLDTRVNPANGKTYHLLAGGSWSAAQAAAVALGGNLVTIDDQAEHDWVLAQWHNWQGVDRDLWIGLNDIAVEGTWAWVDGTPVGFTFWDLNEPNDGGTSGIPEDSVAMRKNNPLAYWNDLADAPTGYHANPFAVVEVGGSGTPFCFGDGTGIACPCANNSPVGAEEGCLNSFALGGKLQASGSSSVSSDTLALDGSQMPNSSALYFQGTTQLSAGAGIVFGDGKRCAGGSVIRLGTKLNSAGASRYPVGADQPVSVRGLVAPGNVRTYQVWYRNAAAFCSPSTFNLTNGIEVTWNP